VNHGRNCRPNRSTATSAAAAAPPSRRTFRRSHASRGHGAQGDSGRVVLEGRQPPVRRVLPAACPQLPSARHPVFPRRFLATFLEEFGAMARCCSSAPLITRRSPGHDLLLPRSDHAYYAVPSTIPHLAPNDSLLGVDASRLRTRLQGVRLRRSKQGPVPLPSRSTGGSCRSHWPTSTG